MRAPIKYGIAAAGSVLLLVLFFALILPLILRAVIVSQLEKKLHRPAAIKAVSFNPFRLAVTVRGFSLREPDNSSVFVSFSRMYANAEIASLFEGGLDLREFRLDNPYVRIVRPAPGRYNFSDLITPSDNQSKPFLFSIARIMISGGTLQYDDVPKKTTQRVTNIALSLPLISNFKKYVEAFVQPSFSAEVNGDPILMTGETKPFAESLETSLEAAFDNITLAKFLPYAPATLNFTMPSGNLSAHLRLRYLQGAAREPELSMQGDFSIRDLELVGLDGTPIMSLPVLSLSGIQCRIDRREFRVHQIAVEGLRIAAAREKDGSLSLQKLARADNATGPAARPSEKTAGKPWAIAADAITLKSGAVDFHDLVPQQPVHISLQPIDCSISHFSDNGTRAALLFSARINAASALQLQGGFSLAPLSADLRADLTGLAITPAQSYLPAGLDIALQSGALSLAGDIAFRQAPGNAAPAITWRGDMRLDNLALGSLQAGQDLVKAAAIEFQHMQAAALPLSLDIKNVSINGLFLRPIVEPDNTINLVALARKAPAEAPAQQPQKNEPLPPVSIGTLEFENGQVQFTDMSVKPRYSGSFTGIQGRISGLSTNPQAQAAINVQAKLNNYAPLTVSGTVSPLRQKLNADLRVNFTNIDMSPFSPYSGKFIGRLIKQGRLSLTLTYTVHDNRLESQNKILLDRFNLGRDVKSPEATSLPVALAISLLKDRNGNIHLDLPVSGSLDDPKFSIGSALLQVLKNLIEKAATSPFALVGALIPGGEQLHKVTFPCGRAQLTAEAKKKLDALAGLLEQKPDLRLEIQPVADAASDGEGLREEMIMRAMRKLRYDDLSDRERRGLTPDNVTIPQDEYEHYLWEAYKKEKFEKPKNALGFTRRLPPDEMKRLMLEHLTATDEDIMEMLQQRGLAVKQYLIGHSRIPPERLFIMAARIDTGKGPEDCSVEFKLK